MSWKTINTNPNYQINEDGEIFSLYTQRIIKTFPDKDGYIKAHLYNKEKNNYRNVIAEYESMSEASRKTGCHISKISLVCSGKRFTTGGFKWKKVEGSTTISSAKSHEMGDSLDKDEDIV